MIAIERRARDGFDRVFIGFEIALGVFARARSFAQHVEARGEATIFIARCPLQRFIYGAAHDESLAHDPHGAAHGGTDEGLARARQQLPNAGRLGVLTDQ